MQYTSGQSRELVRSCVDTKPNKGSAETQRLLKVHFGDGTQNTNSNMQKSLNWGTIKSEDGNEFYVCELYIGGCYNVMKELKHMEELDLTSTQVHIVSKLPYKLKERWRTAANELLKKNQQRARFSDLVTFIKRQVCIQQDQIFGDIHTNILCLKRNTKSKQQTNKGQSSNSTTTTGVKNSKTLSQEMNQQPNKLSTSKCNDNCCICTTDKHLLDECEMLKAQPHDAKVQLQNRNSFCFGFLTRGHMSRTCKRRMTCQHCEGKHPAYYILRNLQKLSKMTT